MDGRKKRSKFATHVEPNFEKISMWKREGWTEETIAKTLKVAYSTFLDYKNKYPELLEVLKEDNDFILAKSERTLMQQAWGENPEPSIVEETEELDVRTGKMKVVKRTVRYDRKPNITALLFLIKNRAPDKWQDRRDISVDSDKALDRAMENFEKVSEQLRKTIGEDNEDISAE